MKNNLRYNTYATGIWFNEGALADTTYTKGIHHLIEHCIFRDSEISSLKEQLENKGCYINASTSYEFTAIYIQSPEKYKYLADNLINNCRRKFILNDKLFEIEKDVVKNEIQYYKSNPTEYLSNILSTLANRTTSNSILGTPSSINGITLLDLENTFSKMLNNYVIVNSTEGVCEKKLRQTTESDQYLKALELKKPDKNLYWLTYGNSKSTYYYGINFSIPISMGGTYTDIFEILYTDFLEVIREKLGLAYRITRNMTMDHNFVYFKFIFLANKNNYRSLIKHVNEIWINFKNQDTNKLKDRITKQKNKAATLQQIKTDNPIGLIKSIAINELSHYNNQKDVNINEGLYSLINFDFSHTLLTPSSINKISKGIPIEKRLISLLD